MGFQLNRPDLRREVSTDTYEKSYEAGTCSNVCSTTARPIFQLNIHALFIPFYLLDGGRMQRSRQWS